MKTFLDLAHDLSTEGRPFDWSEVRSGLALDQEMPWDRDEAVQIYRICHGHRYAPGQTIGDSASWMLGRLYRGALEGW